MGDFQSFFMQRASFSVKFSVYLACSALFTLRSVLSMTFCSEKFEEKAELYILSIMVFFQRRDRFIIVCNILCSAISL